MGDDERYLVPGLVQRREGSIPPCLVAEHDKSHAC
jgi:hypothetical protein